MTAWFRDGKAPVEIKNDLASWNAQQKKDFEFEEYYRESWYAELVCDLFGLLLFGPAFAAAHRALLWPLHRTPYAVPLRDPTHPSYAVRHKTLVMAMEVLGWHKPVIAKGSFAEAEKEALKYIMTDPYDRWAQPFDKRQIEDAIVGISDVHRDFGGHGYQKPSEKTVNELLSACQSYAADRADLSVDGNPLLSKTAMAHTPYAGWICWLGKAHLTIKEPLSFLHVNTLCGQALLQECAIKLAH